MPLNHTITLTTDQLAIIDRSLQQMPYGQVAALINEINQQLVNAHNSAAVEEVAEHDPGHPRRGPFEK